MRRTIPPSPAPLRRGDRLAGSARRLPAALAAAIACSALLAGPASAAGAQQIDASVYYACKEPGTQNPSSLVVRVKATAPATTSPGERVHLTNVSTELNFSARDSHPGYQLAGTFDRLIIQASGGTTGGYEQFGNDRPFPTATVEGGQYLPVAFPVGEPFADYSVHRTATTEPTTLRAGELTLVYRYGPAGVLAFMGGGVCEPDPTDAQLGVIANDPSAPAAPVVDALSPTTGPVVGGNTVTVKGANFSTGTPVVSFGDDVAQDVVVIDDHTLTATAPARMSRVTEKVTVSIGPRISLDELNGTENAYQYDSPELAPKLTSITTSSGVPGTVVTLRGSGLAAVHQASSGASTSSGRR